MREKGRRAREDCWLGGEEGERRCGRGDDGGMEGRGQDGLAGMRESARVNGGFEDGQSLVRKSSKSVYWGAG